MVKSPLSATTQDIYAFLYFVVSKASLCPAFEFNQAWTMVLGFVPDVLPKHSLLIRFEDVAKEVPSGLLWAHFSPISMDRMVALLSIASSHSNGASPFPALIWFM